MGRFFNACMVSVFSIVPGIETATHVVISM